MEGVHQVEHVVGQFAVGAMGLPGTDAFRHVRQPGVSEPFAIPAASRMRTGAGGVLVMNEKVWSS